MEIFNNIISNPLYSLIFGSGGVAIIVFTILGFKKKDKNINIKIDVNDDRKKDEEAKKDSKYVIIRICQQLYFSDTLFS